MRTETEIKTIPIYNTIENEHGEFIKVEKIGEDVQTIVTLYADEGKCIVKKGESIPLGTKLILGTEDSVENYSEMPIAEMVME